MRMCRLAIAVVVVAAVVSSLANAQVTDWSPDGRQIAFEWGRGLEIAPAEGLGGTTVTAADKVALVRWSPTGKLLALLNRSEPGPGSELSILNPGTGKVRGIGRGFSGPFAWREDGNRFACVRESKPGTREMFWYNLVENGVAFRAPISVTPDPSLPMVWLPNTDDLAFVGTDHNVYTVESGEQKRVTTSGDVIGLNLFAGGKKLVWARRSPNLRYILLSVYAYDLTARSVVRLPFPDRVAALNPDPRTAPSSIDKVVFSPDGSHMLLFAIQAGPEFHTALVYTVSLDGRTARQIQRLTLQPGRDDPWSAAGTNGVDAAWSRDGRFIAVRANAGGKQKLFVVGADGTGARILRGG